jgi:hypothetical protein
VGWAHGRGLPPKRVKSRRSAPTLPPRRRAPSPDSDPHSTELRECGSVSTGSWSNLPIRGDSVDHQSPPKWTKLKPAATFGPAPEKSQPMLEAMMAQGDASGFPSRHQKTIGTIRAARLTECPPSQTMFERESDGVPTGVSSPTRVLRRVTDSRLTLLPTLPVAHPIELVTRKTVQPPAFPAHAAAGSAKTLDSICLPMLVYNSGSMMGRSSNV